MKPIIVLLCLAISFQACKKKVDYLYFSNYKPILMPKQELASSVSFQPPGDIGKAGQILNKGNYLFILEPYKGIHYFDNTSPTLPKALGFIMVPGCTAMAIKDNVILVDNGPDLVSIDFVNKVIIGRNAGGMGQLNAPDLGQKFTIYDTSGWPKGSVIVGWQKVKTN